MNGRKCRRRENKFSLIDLPIAEKMNFWNKDLNNNKIYAGIVKEL